MEREKSAKPGLLPSLFGRGEWLVAGVGAALIAVSIGGVALKPLAAAAQSVVQGSPLPTTSTVTPAGDLVAAQDGQTFRDRMRNRMAQRQGQSADGNQPAAPARPAIDKHLSTDQVRDIVAGQLALRGNNNLKVGKATAKEDGVVAVDITTKSGAVVDTREISTKTGLPAKLQKRIEERRAAMAEHGGRPGFGAGRDGHRGGPGMMSHRRFAGHMGGRMGGRGGFARGGDRDLKLTTDQAKKLAEARLIMMGNPHLKVGAVKEKDADTITVDIVAADNSLVTTREIDRHSGHPKRARG